MIDLQLLLIDLNLFKGKTIKSKKVKNNLNNLKLSFITQMTNDL